MKKELYQNIEIPEGVEVTINDDEITVKGELGENKRSFNIYNMTLEKKDDKIIIGSKKATKTEKKMMNTIAAHIKNMMKGVQEKFEYTLKICFSHFPFTVKHEGNKIIVNNFLGEKINRVVEMPEGAEIEINKDMITIKSINREIAGQAAANLEKVTKVRNKDIRVFQDGIYILNKAGRDL